jgi:hypothetical protein
MLDALPETEEIPQSIINMVQTYSSTSSRYLGLPDEPGKSSLILANSF